MAEDWPSPHHHEPYPLPRIEDLPVAWEGYDRERVQAAFDAFYRHVAQLDATLRTLESVEVFRRQAGDLRAELRAMRAAGWAPYPRGYTLTPERSLVGSIPDAVGRIAFEVVFIVAVAAVVAVASFSPLEIAGVMAGAVAITVLIELIAARERRTTPFPAAARSPAAPAESRAAPAEPASFAAPEPAVEELPAAARGAVVAGVEAQPTTGELSLVPVPPAAEEEEEDAAAEDDGGWAPFAEPLGPEPLEVMGALAVEDEQPATEEQPEDRLPEIAEAPAEAESPEAQALPEALVDTEPAAEAEPEAVAEPEPAEEAEPEPPAVADAEQEPEAEPEAEAPAEREPAAEPGPEGEPDAQAEPEPEAQVEPEAEPEAEAPDVAEAETGIIPRRRLFRRRRHAEPQQEPEPAAPRHVRVLPPREAAVAEADLPPWERGFDETDERRP